MQNSLFKGLAVDLLLTHHVRNARGDVIPCVAWCRRHHVGMCVEAV